MNFNQLVLEELGDTYELAEEGDYIVLLTDNKFADATWDNLDVPFKTGTVFEVIYEDEDDMGCYYATPLVSGKPGEYINRDVEYIIPLSSHDTKSIKAFSKEDYERTYNIKNSISSQTKETFGGLIDEL
jgi:hypothetical protein